MQSGLGFRGEHAAFSPIRPLGIVDDDCGSGIGDAGDFRYRFRHAFNDRRLLFIRAAFEHVNVDYGHVFVVLLSSLNSSLNYNALMPFFFDHRPTDNRCANVDGN